MIRGFKTLLSADAPTNAIIQGRVYPIKVPRDGRVPAVAIQMIGGKPENYLSEDPTIDNGIYQVNCWAVDMTTVEALGIAVRDVLQKIGMITRYHGTDFDEEAQWYGFRFDLSIWDSR